MTELESKRIIKEQGIEDLVEYFVCWGLQEIEKEYECECGAEVKEEGTHCMACQWALKN
jgi:hypothetical protein